MNPIVKGWIIVLSIAAIFSVFKVISEILKYRLTKKRNELIVGKTVIFKSDEDLVNIGKIVKAEYPYFLIAENFTQKEFAIHYTQIILYK